MLYRKIIATKFIEPEKLLPGDFAVIPTNNFTESGNVCHPPLLHPALEIKLLSPHRTVLGEPGNAMLDEELELSLLKLSGGKIEAFYRGEVALATKLKHPAAGNHLGDLVLVKFKGGRACLVRTIGKVFLCHEA
jgi:hypothetical protein